MTKMKLLSSVLLVLAVLFSQVSTVAAAPQTQDGTITGTVFQIGEPQTDANGVTTVPVILTVMADDGTETQVTVLVTPEIAGSLVIGQEFTANASDVVPPEEEPADVHPISALLADFFFPDDDGSMATAIDGFHTGDNEAEQVFGFGVIAQALWMATNSEGDTATTDVELAGAILEAKKSGDYSEVTALLGWEQGDEIPSNWGQFKKALKDKHENLGAAHQPKDDDAANDQNPGKGSDNPKKEKKPKKK